MIMTTAVAAHVIDQFCYWSSLLLPAVLLLGRRSACRSWLIVLLAACITWFAIYIAGPWISAIDPLHSGRITDTLWLAFGWLPSLGYALALHGANCLIRCGKVPSCL